MRDLGVDLIVNVHTSVQMYGKWSNSLCMVHALVSNLNQIPLPFPLHSLREE